MGPPTEPPNCFWVGAAFWPKAFFSAQSLARSRKKAEPRIWFVPDLVMALTRPPVERPNSAV